MHCLSHSSEKTGVKELKQKVRILEDALKQNVMQLNASEQARKTAETKSKELDEQVNTLAVHCKKYFYSYLQYNKINI